MRESLNRSNYVMVVKEKISEKQTQNKVIIKEDLEVGSNADSNEAVGVNMHDVMIDDTCIKI
jgi:hypothetical protein